jgi:pyruvate ferredoxin oxidoreductase alpha subunit
MLPFEEMILPLYDSSRTPVPPLDVETPPIRTVRDPLLNKSNFISYAANASWHQEVLAALERARK